MSNQKIADAAYAAMNDPNVESRPGFCSRFVRQVITKAYGGNKYSSLFGASAIDTGKNFKRAGFDASVTQQGQLEIGDILFKMQGSGGFGHVGIHVGPKGVAENSSTPIGRISGAKGYRTLGQWGQWQLVGRLPAESPAQSDDPIIYHLKINDVNVADMPVHNGQPLCPVRIWGKALGFDVDWHESTHRIVFNGRELPEEVVILQEHAFLPITTLVEQAGLRIVENDPGKRLIVVKR